MPAKRKPKNQKPAIDELIEVMTRLRGPGGCPWDREQDHKSIRFHAVEEVYELIDAIEADDDQDMPEQMLAGVYLTYLDPAMCRPFDPTLTRYLNDERNLMPPLTGSL